MNTNEIPQPPQDGGSALNDELDTPIKCFKCGCEKINERVTDTLDIGVGRGMTMEFECICGQCGERVGYWAHGSYDPCFMTPNAVLSGQAAARRTLMAACPLELGVIQQ